MAWNSPRPAVPGVRQAAPPRPAPAPRRAPAPRPASTPAVVTGGGFGSNIGEVTKFGAGQNPFNDPRLTHRGRNIESDSTSRELGNTRTRHDIDLDNRRFDLDSRRADQDFTLRDRNATATDEMRALFLKRFGSDGIGDGAPVFDGGGSVGSPGGPSPVAPGTPGAPGSAEAVGDQAFARAKDRAGLSMQSGLKTLGSIMRGKGLAGSTIERDAIGGLIGGEKARVADVDLDTARDTLGRARKLEDAAGEDRWREREFSNRDREFRSRERQNGLQMLMQMMNAGRMY